jgi:hypothetical protein
VCTSVRCWSGVLRKCTWCLLGTVGSAQKERQRHSAIQSQTSKHTVHGPGRQQERPGLDCQARDTAQMDQMRSPSDTRHEQCGGEREGRLSHRQGRRARNHQIKELTYLGCLVRTHKLTERQASSECGFSSVGRTCSRGATWTTVASNSTRPGRASREDKCRQMMGTSIGCGSGATSRPDQVKMAR